MFAIVTDSSANLDYKALSLENITVAPFIYSMNGEEHSCPPVNGFDGAAYYDAMRNGAVVVTSQVTPHVFKEKMTPLLQKGLDVLFVGMSSGISGSYSSAEAAAKELGYFGTAFRMTDAERQLKDLSEKQITESLRCLCECDMAVKGSRVPGRTTLEKAVVQLALIARGRT